MSALKSLRRAKVDWKHSIDIEFGQSFKFDIEAKVENKGDGDTDDETKVEYYLSTDKDFDKDKDDRLGTDTIDKIKSGKDETKHLNNLQPPTSPGTYYVFVYIDYKKDEEHKSNNYSDAGDTEEYAKITISSIPEPDPDPDPDPPPENPKDAMAVILNIILSQASVTPTVSTNSATSVTSNSAVLNGSVNPNADEISQVSFEYGTSTNYEKELDAKESPLSGTYDQGASLNITGLYPNTNYHYRIKSSNYIGTSYGENMSFTTPFDTTQCPSCSSDNLILKDEVFKSGTDCTCVGTSSLAIGPNVTVENGAKATFKSPKIIVNSGADFKKGSQVIMKK